jgi:SAM-dependent methyltransferase
LSVQVADIADADLADGGFRVAVLCDVLEHLADPGRALARVARLLEPNGVLFLTVPDAGSRLARVMGRRWWSVLPMHLQYFTRGSMRRLLGLHGFTVLEVRSHPKAFSTRYYAERLEIYAPRAARIAVRSIERLRLARRLVSPDFHDRMAVIAVLSSVSRP